MLSMLVLVLALPRAGAQTVPVALNLPSTVSANIVAGATSLDVPFTASGADSLSFDRIVPVDGAVLSLVDPAGQVVLAAGDPRLAFNPASTRTPALPRGLFQSALLRGRQQGQAQCRRPASTTSR